MRIVSLNAWGGAVFESLASWLPDVRADVLCLQEVTRTPGLTGWTTFDDGERRLAQRANLFDDVRRLLPGHQGSFVASDAGPVHDATGAAHRQDFGLAVFVAEHLPVIAQSSSFIHGSFVDHGAWITADRPRIAQGIRVLDRASDRPVSIVHAHGLRDPSGKHDTPARRRQADRIASLLEGLRGPGDFSVVCGDLNLLPDSVTFDVLAGIGLTELVGTADTRTSLYANPVRHASYLLVSQPDGITGFEAPAVPEVSDHRALIVDL